LPCVFYSDKAIRRVELEIARIAVTNH
jgi:hypothetical protein